MSAYPRHNTAGQRQHTNPSARLKAWEAPRAEGEIWCYGKQLDPGRRIYRQKIASATVLRSIWTKKEEERSNTEVEQPAASGLECLTKSVEPRLHGQERQAVARYMMSLFRRGWRELVAQQRRLQSEVARLRASVNAGEFSPEFRHYLEEQIADLSKHPPGRPLPISEVCEVMAAMRWTVLRRPDSMFVNSDTPVQIVPYIIIDSESEVTLALSPTRALICDWGFPRPSISIRGAIEAEVLEINRRTASGAEQYIYFADRPTNNLVRDLLNGGARPRIIDDKGRRAVPRKHCRDMERHVQRILLGRSRECMKLVERLRDVEAAIGVGIQRDDPTP